jgi:hypothetical protein
MRIFCRNLIVVHGAEDWIDIANRIIQTFQTNTIEASVRVRQSSHAMRASRNWYPTVDKEVVFLFSSLVFRTPRGSYLKAGLVAGTKAEAEAIRVATQKAVFILIFQVRT